MVPSSLGSVRNGFIVSVLAFAGCDSSPTQPSDPPPGRTVVFEKILERQVSEGLPSGPAVTPDGRWIVSLSFGRGTVTLYDAETLEPISEPLGGLFQPHAVVTTPDGSMAVLTSRFGVTGLRLPSLEPVFNSRVLPQARHLVRDRAGENYYVTAEGNGVARLNSAGETLAVFEDAFIPTALSLTRDESEVLVMTETGRRFMILSATDLEPRLSVDLPEGFVGQAVIPLRDNEHAIVIGGAFSGETEVDPPIRALPVDLATGSLGPFQVLYDGPCCNIAMGDGNEWTDAGEATAIVPTIAGTITIDTNHGTGAFHSAQDLQRDSPPCCDIASYPGGDRVVFTGVDLDPIPFEASLVIYNVHEQIISLD